MGLEQWVLNILRRVLLARVGQEVGIPSIPWSGK